MGIKRWPAVQPALVPEGMATAGIQASPLRERQRESDHDADTVDEESNPLLQTAHQGSQGSAGGTARLVSATGVRSARLTRLLSPQKLGLLATMYIAYMMSVFNGVAFEVSMPAVVDSDLGMTKADFGFAIAVGQVATVTGKIFCGFFVDMRGASSAFYESLFLMGVVMFLGVVCMQIGLRSGALACFFLLKLAKSAVWPAMAKAAKAAFDSAIFGRVWGVLVTSSRVGAVCGAVILSPFVLLGWAWPPLMVAGGLVMVAGILRMFTRHDAAQAAMMSQPGKAPTISMREAVRLYGKDKGLWLIVASEGMLLTVMETGTLVPLYMHDHLGADLDDAARLYSLFPLGMVVFTAAGGFMYDALPAARRADMLLLLGLCSATSYYLLASASSPSAAGAFLFCAGGCFAPAKYLPPTIYTLEHVDSQHSGKVIALMDVPGYCKRPIESAVRSAAIICC